MSDITKDGYKEKLREYLRRLEKLKEKYKDNNVYPKWPRGDYLWAKGATDKLKDIEEELGLSQEEIKEIREEIKVSL